jgi:phosphoadenosine phosphosulfate reductase
MLEIEAEDIQQLQARFEHAYPQTVLQWAAETFGDRLAIVTSFGPTGIVQLHMMSEIAPDTPVLTLDTGLLFPETYALIDEIEDRLNLNLIRVKPRQSVEQQAAAHGDALWERDPDKCCNLRKTVPLGEALDGYAAWIAGLRRDQSSQRALVPIISREPRYGRIKLNPLAGWSEDMVWMYIQAHDLPYHPLHDQGFPSIGCMTCTHAVHRDGYTREGRWGSFGKSECGIHTVYADDMAAK